jgi:chromodomain-helicase-DNA-binding protein 7
VQFLCDGLEEDMTARWEAARAAAAAEGAAGLAKEVEALTRASGKMLLLHKLLPKLRAEGRQVSAALLAG